MSVNPATPKDELDATGEKKGGQTSLRNKKLLSETGRENTTKPRKVGQFFCGKHIKELTNATFRQKRFSNSYPSPASTAERQMKTGD